MSHPNSARIELIKGHSREVAFDLVEPLARFLVLARETCWGDLDRALLMIVITLRSSSHPAFRRLHDGDLETRRALPGFGTNPQSLADSTGIPKESVRRKVKQLMDAGWVVREGQNLVYSAEGYKAVEPVRDAIIRMYARGLDVIEALEHAASDATLTASPA